MAEKQSEQSQPFYEEKLILVDPGQSPIRLDKFLGDRLENVSRNKIQVALKAEAITVNKKPCKSNYKVRPGDRIEVVMPKFQDPTAQIQPEDIPLNIEYEDEDILIVVQLRLDVQISIKAHRMSSSAEMLDSVCFDRR
jgi:23S rRNA pseudouridine1911/1915/1917 synthase